MKLININLVCEHTATPLLYEQYSQQQHMLHTGKRKHAYSDVSTIVVLYTIGSLRLTAYRGGGPR